MIAADRAALDQALAALDDCVTEFTTGLRAVLDGADPADVWLALSASLRSSGHSNLCDLCAGALVLLARRKDERNRR